MVQRTVPILVRIARSSVDGRPIRTTCVTDQQAIRIGVDGALEGVSYGSPVMILLGISQHLRLSKRGSTTGLVINAPAKYAANYFLLF